MNGNITQEVLKRVAEELKERLEATTEEAFLPENIENGKFEYLAGKRTGYQDALSRLIFKLEELRDLNFELYGDEE